MYIGLKNIEHLFSEDPHILFNSDGIHCLTGWTKFSNASRPLTNHLLYVTEYDPSFMNLNLPHDLHILCITQNTSFFEEIQKRFSQNSLLLVANTDPESIYAKLQNYFNIQCGVGLFGQTLLEFLAFENGLEDAIEYSFAVFQNPIFVFDTNFNLIAATWNAIEQLNIKDDVIQHKGPQSNDFKMINRQNNIHNKVRRSEIPIRAYNEVLGYEQMYCAINTQKNLGHIVVSAIHKPFEPIDTEFMLILKKYVDQQMKKDAFIRNSRGFNYEYFLKDLLDQKIATNRDTLARMKYVESEFSGNMYCMTVETARSNNTISTIHIRNLLESRIPNSKTLIYNGQVITIITIPKNQLIPSEYIDSLSSLCFEQGIFAGLSNCFQDILSFREYYDQSLRSIELGISKKDSPGLFMYRDYYLNHIKNIFTQVASPEIFCHPKMKFLMDYDKLYHSELAYTLYMYLSHERNLAATSDAMDMHRSSLVYRFKKIHSLLNDDFDDYQERMYMILSYEMNCNSKKDFSN